MANLEAKTIVVTGGAGLIGREFCKAIAAAEASVIVADMQMEKAVECAAMINAALGRECAYGVSLDMTAVESLKSAISFAVDRTGRIDGLVNSAYPRNKDYGKKVEDVSYEGFCENVSMHLGGYFLATREFAEYFKSHGGGVVVCMSSIYGVMAPRFEIYEGTAMTMPVEYAAIKAGIQHLMRYMAKYYKGQRIRFNCLSPGGVLDSQPAAFLERYASHAMSKGMLDPADLAGALVFLLSDDSRYVDGQNLVVDDGWSL